MEKYLPPKSETVCFSGYRPHKLPHGGDESTLEMQRIKENTKAMITAMVEKGKTNFINGLMMGYDLIAIEQVLELKKTYTEIKCISVAPFSIGYFLENNWTEEWKQRALQVCRNSDTGFSLSERYKSGIYYERDRFMVDNSSEIIVCYDGQSGGTKYTVDFAVKKGLTVHNVLNGIEKNGKM